jgi:hypothetical protein
MADDEYDEIVWMSALALSRLSECYGNIYNRNKLNKLNKLYN